MKTLVLKTILALLVLSSCSKKESAPVTVSGLEHYVDSLVQVSIDSTKIAGVAIEVTRGDEVLLLKSYGFADLEFGVKLPVDASFEIGSVTKQFTAVAILQLVEQGKIGLDDDITKYLKFNTHGKKVTVRQLLSHTSGIKAYTEMPVFEKISPFKYSRDTLLRIVEKEPFDFNPGEALIYNNSGFFMLGQIIEKASGLSYEEYLSKNIFAKAGMSNSYYCSESKIRKNRAHGYDTREKGLQRAGFLNHTWPYAAGSICSTVEDLTKWNKALHHGKILSEAMYGEFISPVSLEDGTKTRYAKGITVWNYLGNDIVSHGGGINGFLSENRFFPKEDLSIIVLINSTGPVAPAKIADAISNYLLKTKKPHYSKYPSDLSKFTGTYLGRGRGEDLKVVVAKNDTAITVAVGDDKAIPLQYLKDNNWIQDQAVYYFTGKGEKLDELRIDRIYGYYILKRVQKTK